MDKSEKSKNRDQQKAIDGILFGTTRPTTNRLRPVLRRRTTDISGPVIKTQAAPKVTKSVVAERVPDMSSLDLSLDELMPSQKEQTKTHRINWNVLRHPKLWNWRKIRKWSLITLASLLALALITGGVLVTKGYFNLHKVLKGGGSSVVLKKHVTPVDVKKEGDGRINMLLLGIGGEGHDGPDLTDTILIASIDPVNHTMALLSIPRDLFVAIPGHASMKLNAVYETGKYAYLGHQSSSNTDQKAVEAGFTLLDTTIQQVTGININYHALVNFQAFQQAVDTLGGISVDVPEILYDPTMAWQNGGNAVLARPGLQTFAGKQALMYVRSRETSSDFARGQRQRAVIVALMQKVFTVGTLSNPQKVSSLLDAFGNNIVTDLSLTDLMRLYSITNGISAANIQSVGLADEPNNFLTTGMIGTQSVVKPRAGLNNYDAIIKYLRLVLKDGYITKENAQVALLNGTTTPDLATTRSDILKSYGYNVISAADVPTKQYQKTIIVDLTDGKKPYTAQYLKNRFDVNATVTKMPDKTIKTQSADFVIILGVDETTNSQN